MFDQSSLAGLLLPACCLAAASISCGRPDQTSPPIVVDAALPSFTKQLEDVRAGRSDVIHSEREPVTDEQLAELRRLANLRRVNLPRAQFSDQGLAHLAEVPELTHLRFGSPNVTDQGLAHVAQMKHLRALHLIGVPITDAGLEHLKGMTWLESFYLDGGRTTDEGLYRLLKALPKLHFHRDQLHLPEDPKKHEE